ncbi:hypothetical protein [Rhodococcus koreensis]
MPAAAIHPDASDRGRRHRRSAETSTLTQILQLCWPGTPLVLGVLSVLTFWMWGFGIALGSSAIASGVLTNRALDVEEDESGTLMALLGMIIGALGITASVISLVSALPT